MGETDMFKLVQHLIVQDDGKLPTIPDCLYAYIMAGNGVLLYAKRDNLEVLIPISRATIVGLPPLEPFVNMPRVPAILMSNILQASGENLPNEILFWFNFDQDRQVWNLDAPLQVCRPASVFPVDKSDPLGLKALIDLHSHALMEPFFSPTDNKDEQGFRLFAVIGKVNAKPEIRVRVGVYGNYWNIPADMVFEMPEEIQDAYYGKGDLEYDAYYGNGDLEYDETNIEEELTAQEDVVGIEIFDDTACAE
jgi:PRTRC genetic system protein A